MGEVRRALLSVSNKEGLADFAKGLYDLGFELTASEGTASFLRAQRIPVRNLEEVTGIGSILGGRVKTLHPKVHAGILAIPTNAQHTKDLAAIGAERFDLVVVNLYPFEETIAQGASTEAIIENIDIGGVALLRSAAKNAEHVAVVSNPRQYPDVLDELRRTGDLSRQTRDRLALAAFARTSEYDIQITNWWQPVAGYEVAAEPYLRMALDKAQDLRYGENPYQKAAFYRNRDDSNLSLAEAEKLHGKELSFNNLLDFDAALALAVDFRDPVAVVIKHGNPSGVAVRDRLPDAYAAAYASDSKAAYGSVAAFNRTVDLDTVKGMKGHFIEGIIAPDFAPDALEQLRKRENIRLLRPRGTWELRGAP